MLEDEAVLALLDKHVDFENLAEACPEFCWTSDALVVEQILKLRQVVNPGLKTNQFLNFTLLFNVCRLPVQPLKVVVRARKYRVRIQVCSDTFVCLNQAVNLLVKSREVQANHGVVDLKV